MNALIQAALTIWGICAVCSADLAIYVITIEKSYQFFPFLFALSVCSIFCIVTVWYPSSTIFSPSTFLGSLINLACSILYLFLFLDVARRLFKAMKGESVGGEKE